MPGVAMRRHVQRTASASNGWLTNMLCLSSMTWRRGDVETWRRGDVETWGRGDVETWRRGDVETWRRGDVEAAWASRSDAGHRSPMTWYTPAQPACQRVPSPLPLGHLATGWPRSA